MGTRKVTEVSGTKEIKKKKVLKKETLKLIADEEWRRFKAVETKEGVKQNANNVDSNDAGGDYDDDDERWTNPSCGGDQTGTEITATATSRADAADTTASSATATSPSASAQQQQAW
ncbi:unnamed protein product [Parnassius apollo]|uniref:(apollo) hypothetical protein n=1 Tax=Parnassius apollo TaxID=110799 RepID=A0A8S3W3P8_PARAO|nr:unnamed protein product [Parnassius apollo]